MEQKSRIRTLFLQPSDSYTLAGGSRLLGVSPGKLKREAEEDRREEYRSGDQWRFTWRQLVCIALRRWTLAEVQDALGSDAKAVLPPLLTLRTVTVRLPAFIVCTLETVASRYGTTLDACLHQELMELAGVWAKEMEASHPGFRRAYLFPGRDKMPPMATKKKPTTKREPREDFNQAAFRIVQQATREKPKDAHGGKTKDR
jgi:hypothetical protein